MSALGRRIAALERVPHTARPNAECRSVLDGLDELLVESQRVDGRIQQRALARLRRLDELPASPELDRLLGSPGRFA
jgi:hypothetical protein